jgi:hypothetical protein
MGYCICPFLNILIIGLHLHTVHDEIYLQTQSTIRSYSEIVAYDEIYLQTQSTLRPYSEIVAYDYAFDTTLTSAIYNPLSCVHFWSTDTHRNLANRNLFIAMSTAHNSSL